MNESAYNILIVDDDEAAWIQYKRLLGYQGYTLIFAKNRKEALTVMDKFSVELDTEVHNIRSVIALAILDQDLKDFDREKDDSEWPDATGLHLIGEVKCCFRPTRVVMITEHKWKEGKDRGWEAGKLDSNGYYAKTEMLNERLKHLVGQELQKFDQAVKTYNKEIAKENKKRAEEKAVVERIMAGN